MSKRKKTTSSDAHEPIDTLDAEVQPGTESTSVTTVAAVSEEIMEQARGESAEMEGAPSGKKRSKRARTAPPVVEEIVTSELATDEVAPESMSEDVPISDGFDAEATVNLVGELPLPGRDDLDEPTVAATSEQIEEVDHLLEQRKHLRGLLEALVFASDAPIATKELAKLASAPQKQVRELLGELQHDFSTRGIHLDEVAGGWVFRTSPQYAPFVRDLTKQKPVRLSRAQIETLAIIAYRQPITRPEIDDVRGVDSGPVMKLLLERDLVRILGKRDEPGRPFIFGTTNTFLEFFGLRSLKDLPTLKEFTELTDESRQEYEEELGEVPDDAAAGLGATQDGEAVREGEGDESLGDDATSDDADASTDDEAAPESGDEHRALRESMRVPISEPEIDDEPHASDQDGPTLTSEAPPPLDDDDN